MKCGLAGCSGFLSLAYFPDPQLIFLLLERRVYLSKICLLLVGKSSKGREAKLLDKHLVSFFLKEDVRGRKWCWKTRVLAEEKKFSLFVTEQLSELPHHLQLLISVFIFSNFFHEGGASVPQLKYANFFTQQHVPWQVLCPEPWDSC